MLTIILTATTAIFAVGYVKWKFISMAAKLYFEKYSPTKLTDSERLALAKAAIKRTFGIKSQGGF